MSMDSDNQSQGRHQPRRQSKGQSQRNPRGEQQQQKQAAPKLKPLPELGAAQETKKASKQETSVISDVSTKGKNGELNITVEKYWGQVGNDFPCGWIIGTAPGNQLQVTVRQLSYRKTYSSTAKLKTGLVPVAPIGTKGKVDVADTTTGERREIEFQWYCIGYFSSFWRLIKKLFTNKRD